MRIADTHRGDGKRFVVHADEKVDRVSGTRIRDACRARPYMKIRQRLT